MYFCKNFLCMKTVLFYTILFLIILGIGSCGVYEEQCPGFGENKGYQSQV